MSLITTDLDFRITAKEGITESAGVISQWDDQQGAHSLTVPATFSGPKIGDVQLNGHDAVTFNGVDQLLDNSTIGERRGSASNFSMTYLYCRAPASNGFRYMVDQADSSTVPRMAINTMDTNQVRGRSGGSSNSVLSGYTADTWMIVTIRWARSDLGSGDDVISKLYIDGTEVNTNTFLTASAVGIRLGGRSDDSGYAPFSMVEMLEYHNISSAHTQNQIDQNVTYLQDEWAANAFEIVTPADQATGVSDPFDFEVSNPNEAQGFYKQISKTAPDGSDELSDLEKDIVGTNVVTSISGLDAATTHYLKAVELLTLGGQSTDALFFDDYNRADASGWGDDYTSTVNSGTASKFIESNEGVIEIDPSSRFLIDVAAPIAQDFDVTWEFENQNVSTDYQPTLHFATQGDWSAGGRIHSYWAWMNGDEITLGRTSASYSNQEFKTETFSRTANTKYKVRALKIGFDLKVAIWPSSGSQDGWTLEHEDTSEISSEGTLAIDVATLAGSSANERMTFSIIEYKLAAEAPEITNIEVGEDSATLTYSTVPFDNEGYEYQYREAGGSFGSWTNIDFTNPFQITSLALGDYEAQISAMHNGQRSPVSEIVPFTIAEAGVSNMVISPANPELSEEQGSTVTLSRTLDSTGGATKATTWSITQPANGSVSIKSQSDSQCVLEAGSGLVIGNTGTAKAVADFDGLTEDEVTYTIVEGLNLDITDTAAADKATLALFYQTTGADWETEKQHFDADNNDFYLHTGNATGWSTDAESINLDPAGTLPFGVETEEINGEWRVVSLKLNSDSDVGWKEQHRQSNNGTKGGNNITGSIGPDFNWQLFRCKYINLKHNYINLQIPRKIYTPHLQVFHLNGTYEDMVPEIAPNISNKMNWTQRSNRISGELYKEIGNATNLEILVGRGRHWGAGDEETGTNSVFPADQYAIGGPIPDEILNTKIAFFDFIIHKFTSFPVDFPDELKVFFLFTSVRNPATNERFSHGIGVSKLAFLENRPNLTRVKFDRMDLGVGTSDNSPFPDLSASTPLIDLTFGFNGIQDTLKSWMVDGTISGLVGGGIATLVAEENPIQGPLPSAFDFGFSHRFARSTIRLTNCGIGGEIPADYMDPGTIQYDIAGNGFTNDMDVLSAGWGQLQRIRNIHLQGNNFSGGLPIMDWYSHVRQNTSHGLRRWSRIRVNNSGLNLSLNQPKKPWEIEQKQRRWYYDNKNNIIDNVSGSYTLGDAQNDGYSSSFITNTLGTSNWNNSDPVKGTGRFMNKILDKIYSGWAQKDF